MLFRSRGLCAWLWMEAGSDIGRPVRAAAGGRTDGQHLLLHLHQPDDGDGAGAGGGHSAAAHFLWRIGDDDGDAVPGRAAGHRPREPEDGGLSPYLRGAVGGAGAKWRPRKAVGRSEEHTSELQSLMRSSYAVFCLNKKMVDLVRQSERICTKET